MNHTSQQLSSGNIKTQQAKILKVVTDNNQVSSEYLSHILNIRIDVVRTRLSELNDFGLIAQNQFNNKTYYYLTDNPVYQNLIIQQRKELHFKSWLSLAKKRGYFKDYYDVIQQELFNK